jgi:hypothetical protein
MRVFVLLFNAGTNNEGIHTIRMGDRNLVLMFEEEDDATRYALLLEAQDFPAVPTVEAVHREEIEEFCRNATLQDGAKYDCKFVPAGMKPQNDADRLLLIPPEDNVEETDWQLEPKATDKDETMSPDALEQIRRKLEGLL